MKLASRNLPRTWVGISGMVLSMLAAPVQVHPEAQFRAANDPNVAWLGSNREKVTEFAKLVNGQLSLNPLALHSARIHLQYPDGQIVTAERDRLETYANDNFAWVGHVEGQPLSRVCLGSSGGTMAGFIDRTAYTPGDRWHLLPNGNGAYSFSKDSGTDFTCSASSTLPKGQRKALQAGLSIVHSPAATADVHTLAQPTIIDLLVVYSPASRVRFGQNGLGAMINQAVADANTTFANSYAGIFIKLVGVEEVAHVENPSVDINSVLSRMVTSTDGFLDTVPLLRNQYGADLVTLISEDTGASGVAYIPYLQGTFHSEYSYNVVNDYSLIGGALTHELGHNLGCNHDRGHTVSVDQFVTPYGFGYQSCGKDALGFRDIMAYECLTGGTSQRLNYFSNPWLSYLGRPLGVDYASDPTNASDNARSIRETAPTIASFRSSVQSLPLGLSGLSASAPAFNQVALTWSAPGTTTAGVELQRSTDGGLTWSAVATLPGAPTSWIDRPLTASTSYSYRVRAFNSAGSGAFSGIAAVTTLGNTAVPVSATSLIGQEVTTGRIDLSWIDSANNEDGYRIERSDNGGAYTVLATLGWDATGFNDGVGLQPGHTYSYRVIAFNALGDGTAAGVTISIATQPGSPTNLSLVPLTATSVQISWQDNANNETGFVLEKSTDGINFVTAATRDANINTFTNTGLMSGTTYFYRVWSQNISGLSPTAASANVTWGQLPIAPSSLTVASLVAGQINLSWTDTSANETSVSIERADSDSLFSVVGTVAAKVIAFTDTSVASATSYSYRIRAVNPFGNSAYTTSVSATSRQAVVPIPAAPTSLTASGMGQTQVNLGWNDLSNNETGFLIERATGAGVFIVLTTTGANITAYSDVATTPATSYTYRVSALNSGGVSAPSPSLSVTTLPLAPTAPTGLAAAAISATQIDLTWGDPSTTETGFAVERATGIGSYLQIGTTATDGVRFQDTTVSAGGAYSYRVRSFNSGGYSTYSPISTVTTPALPAAPSALKATLTGQTQIDLTWTDNSADESGFAIERSSNGGSYASLATTGLNATSFQDPTGVAGGSYCYRVRAFNSIGNSVYSGVVSVTIPSAPPAPPANLVASVLNQTQISLNWKDRSSDETAFQIERSVGSGAFTALVTLSANAVSYTDMTASAATTYSYRVRAINSGGSSAFAVSATVTTPSGSVSGVLPTAASGLVATAMSVNQLSLTWLDNSTNENGFKLEFLSGTTWIQLANLPFNTKACTIGGVSSKATYSFRVSAYNSVGRSAPTTVSITMP